ncbi:MAG: DUF262 domain-containing protein [Muribaculaceae bacterium]|nr:DUF262 domain-containing protein [Muribaculaceae bacterium]
MISGKSVGEVQTLRELIERDGRRNPTRIIIPQLQRDYAQGRDDKEELRDNFLNSIFSVLDGTDAAEHIYDFVYGKFPDEVREFYPVDGQQRLTTFFLLHVYIGKRAGEDLSFLLYRKKDGHLQCNFSYETRDSCRLFCEKLCMIDASEFVNIVAYIRDQQWYNGTWQSDPTIKSMMVMLGAIEARCRGYRDPDIFKMLWGNLTTKIKFWVLSLDDLKSSDALYIKMNSRGKHLTDFENFKAEVEGILSGGRGYVPGSFALKIDTTWTNLFWSYRQPDVDFVYSRPEDRPQAKIYSDNGLDDRMLAFLRNFLVLYGVRAGRFSHSGQAAALSDTALAKCIFRYYPQVVMKIATVLDFFYKESLNSPDGRLSKFFSRFLTTENEQSRFARSGQSGNDYLVNVNMNGVACNTTDVFELFMGAPTLQQRVLGYAFAVWIIEKAAGNDIPEPEFKNRLRMLRNLIANSYLHDDENQSHIPLRQTLKSVEALVTSGISAVMGLKDEFAQPQKDQERVKCSVMASDRVMAVLVPEVENHSMLRGNLSQMMPLQHTVLSKFRDVFCLNCNLDEIEAALLTYGDYSRTDKERRMYGGESEAWWRDYIMLNINKNTGTVLVKALLDAAFNGNNLDRLVSNYAAAAKAGSSFDWCYYLSKYREMRDISRAVYRIPAGMNYSYVMCNASGRLQGNERTWNPYNYVLSQRFADTSLGNWGAKLVIGDYSLDVEESTIAVWQDDALWCRIAIPQNNGVDSVDRIEFAEQFIPLLSDRATPDEIEQTAKSLGSRADFFEELSAETQE